MKIKVKREVEKDIKSVIIDIPVRYGEEDIPNDFPHREGDRWKATIDVETGQIQDWPQGKTGSFDMKVYDEGTYTLIDQEGNEVAKIDEDYVPNGLVPGSYGDYVEMEINKDGIVTNWPTHPSFHEFDDSND